MREGLRSRTRLGKISGNGGVVQKEKVDVKNEAFDLGGKGLGDTDLTIEKKEGVKHAVKEECDLDLEVSTSGNVDLVENENKNDKSCFREGGSIVEAEVDRKANEVLIGGRVLRSRLKRGDDKISSNGGNDGVVSGNNRGHGGFERIKVKKECVEADEFLTDSNENERVTAKKEGSDKMNLKRKRGRPPKIALEEEDQLVDQSPRKRGRPPKDGRQSHIRTVVRKGKAGLKKGKEGLTMKDSPNVNVTCSRRSSSRELKKKGFSPVNKNKFGKVSKTEINEVAAPSKSNAVNALVAEKSGKSKVKQLVRDQIMERLSAAGWTVDYRPRNGRVYNDAVYVSLDGKTHWSITLAYNRLKMHYEAGDGEGKVYRPGFEFTPIPPEDFKILTKVMNKKRKSKDKLAPFGGKGGKTVDGVNRKGKEKQSSGAGMGKSVKGKMKRKRSHLREDDTNVTSLERMLVVRDHKRHKTQNKKRCAPLVRNTEGNKDSEIDGYVLYSGKRTMLAWMIDLGAILQNGKVHYMQNRSKSALLDGKITGDGIHCGCCNEIITISDFGAHAGSKHSDPLKNIYSEEGTSLLQCLLDSWNKQDESERKGFHFVDVAGEDPNDDTCAICGDGGDLICCDGCPSTFHQSCLDVEKFPSGDWHCIYCCCKFCGLVGGSSNQRAVHDTLLTCHLCDEKYHTSCIEANVAKTDDSRDAFFCGDRCEELSKRLEMLLGVKHEIEDGFSLTFIRRSDVGFDASQIKPQIIECNSKLAVALSIMDECFLPYIDNRSGINLIHSILYNCGSNFKRLNYSGFVTAILERGDEIISAATIRIHGNQLAEMPFIGTRYMYRRQGMCRRLLDAIEWALGSLNVELLVIPAISELRETWTSVFGFESLESTNKQIIKNMNLLVFPHVDMLQKKISKHKFADENLIPTEVSSLNKNHTICNVANWDGTGSSGSDLINSTGIPPSNTCQIDDKTISIESGCWLPKGSLSNAPDITSNTIPHNKSPKDVTCQVVCKAVPENLAVDDKSTANAHEYVTDSCGAKDRSTYKNTSCSCILLNRDEKPTDLDSQLNNCCVPYEEKHCLSMSPINTETTKEGHNVGGLLEVTEKFPNEVVSNNSSAENPAPGWAESIPIDSQIVFSTRKSKDSADSIYHDSHEISDSCELRSKIDCVQPYFIGSKEIHVEPVNGCGSHARPDGDCASGEAESCSAKTSNLLTNIHPGDCQSIPVSSGICVKTADGVNEKNKESSVAEADTDLQVDQTARSNAPSLWGPNTASGAALHCASAGSTSCGSTEGIVLSNQAS